MDVFKKIVDYEAIIFFLLIPLFWFFLLFTFPNDSSYWLEYWWMFPIALLFSAAANIAGISGAALFVPFFFLVFPFLASPLRPSQSVMLGLITESFGLTSSALAFIKYGLVDKKLGFYTVLGAAPFVIGGSFFTFIIPEKFFNFLIASALIISVYLLINNERKKSKKICLEKAKIGRHHNEHPDNVTMLDKMGKEYKYCRCGYRKRFLGFGFGGVFQGMAGFGIGELGIVSMVMTEIPIRVAIGTSQIIVALTAVIASITHLSQAMTHNVETPWNILFMTVPAVISGGQIAPHIAARLKTSFLENFVAGLFTFLALALFYSGLKGI
jgi:uncharacterized membrane protein YfcA